ncbi:PDC sensor domain-containing protein [Halorhabdus rudnickae]|uniref:PDC sensor domain-containing protein n=1 Tax=Halorhabdus rudnickae TaxID=1775544 RepID=UPI001082A295|nr:methyl-accepting chemotaxis protein [Halorhabdus rudnickae]
MNLSSIPSMLVPGFIRRRYLAKFVLAILSVVLVIAAVGAVSYVEINGTVRADANAQLETTAEMQAEQISSWVESLTVQTRTASASPVLREGNTQEVQGHLVEEQARMGVNVRAIHYIDAATGKIVTSTNPVYRDTTLESLEEPWADKEFRSGFDLDEEVWTSPQAYESPTLDDQVMAFASPVPDRPDRVVVVIGTLEYRIEQLQQENTSQSTVILDAEGNDVFQSANTSIDSGGDALEAALGGRVTRTSNGGTVQAYVPVSNTPWVAVSRVPAEEAYGVATNVGHNVILMVLLSLGALGIVAVVLGRQTVAPLTTLRDRAAKMEAGDLEVELETDRIDEIGRLYDGFDSMRNSLREQITEAEQARKQAEVSRAEAMEMNEYLQDKAEEYSQIMGECASGDLTQRMETDGENDAMDRIATDFNEMIEELENTTGQLRHFAKEVEQAGESVESSAESLRGASEQVAESIQRISDDAYKQRERLDDLSTTIENIVDQLEPIARETDVDVQTSLDQLRDVTETVEELAEAVEVTMAESENVAGAAEEQTAELSEVSQRAQDLTRYAGPLKDVLDSFETESKHEFYFPTGAGSPTVNEEE